MTPTFFPCYRFEASCRTGVQIYFATVMLKVKSEKETIGVVFFIAFTLAKRVSRIQKGALVGKGGGEGRVGEGWQNPGL